MPKQLKKIEDFSGGTSGYFDPQKIQDTDLAQCSGFKPEPGELVVLGDMKALYTLGTGDTAASGNIDIEAGYGLFTFSHDYDMSSGDVAALNSTNYFVFMSRLAADKHNRFDIYDDILHTWRTDKIELGGSISNNRISSINPCFFFVDGALRISPGYFNKTASGAVLNSDTLDIHTEIGNVDQIDATDADDYVYRNDLVSIGGIEAISMLSTVGYTTIWRNMTGMFTGTAANDASIDVLLDTRWRGIVKRKNFQSITTIGTFTEWYSTFMHPRSPVEAHAVSSPPSILSFQVAHHNNSTSATDAGYTPRLHIGTEIATPNTAESWNGIDISLYVTALYDDSKQESQPRQIVSSYTTQVGYEFDVWVGMEYTNDGTDYELNKRITGARLYYQEENTGDERLYQLLEIDFEVGCRKVGDEIYSPWVRWADADGGSDSDRAAACPLSAGAAQDAREGANVFAFPMPLKLLTYEINTGYLPEVSTHARFKTAVVANRRLYVGNVYQDGSANGDRMLKSPVDKFDILPSINVIDVAIGDGDEIVKLETFADRLLQFKKRTLYLINISGDYEFLESQHSNMGVENPSQVCRTEYGIAWVNKFGVYLYDGRSVTELTRGKLKTVDTTAATSSQELGRARALNVTESNVPIIGYHPLKKWLIVHPESTVADIYDTVAWIYDFKNGSWTWSQEFTATNDLKTNIVSTHDNELVFAAGVNAAGDSTNTPDFFKLQDGTNDPAANKLFLLTKDFTLDVPSVKKNIYSVYVTYSAGGDTNLEADLIYKHSTGETTVAMQEASGSTYYDDSVGFKTTSSKKITIELVPSSTVKNANSFQFKISNPDGVHDVSDDFRLYSISFRYRAKGVH